MGWIGTGVIVWSTAGSRVMVDLDVTGHRGGYGYRRFSVRVSLGRDQTGPVRATRRWVDECVCLLTFNGTCRARVQLGEAKAREAEMSLSWGVASKFGGRWIRSE